jgi:cysteine desulfurase/selenocysteine lyase
MSNVDGRVLMNGRDLIKDVHAAGGLVILDAAQSFGHERARLRSLDYDALCFSAHKTYGPSLGVIVVKKSLLTRFQFDFIGGGMVDDVSSENYELAPQDPSSWFEPGLQNFSGIVGLGAALAWLEHYHPEDREPDVQQSELAEIVFRALRQMPSVRVINQTARPIISFYSEKIDAHRLAIFLSQAGIMVRSGYFCCHAYLKEAMKYPPLVRISLGLNNTRSQVEHLSKTLGTILRNL